MSQLPTTRKRSSPQAQTRAGSNASTQSLLNEKDLPPSRTSQPLRDVSAPLSNTRLSNLIYLLIGLTTLLCAFYTYRTAQHKLDVGWWSRTSGRPQDVYMATQKEGGSGASPREKGRENEVEERINALAEALGMPAKELASVIAGAVRAHVPPASLSSVAARETGEAVNVLVGEPEEGEVEAAKAKAAQPTKVGVVEGIMHGVDSFAGMDEPFN